ncbi:hypothetical protein [Microvirga tunisiensis]|uniref:Uncharacterized protein n=1 Tax=Microvirga tunisiensis TaxID=2108360 RepID=A0A5N7MR86_9HYPH|nr:hypothetical protein [Microvirga tunisiensis]MPR11499.1 hypothetical protein [Microvirga tunisiensis]MPR28624.1 hypothetical protein [Microvirga tunisiensis]
MSPTPDRSFDVEAYCVGKILSECGEFAQVGGNALCFGIDTPDGAKTGRSRIEEELGDIIAAISFASLHEVVAGEAVTARARKKLQKLLDPTQRDNLGRSLAPQPRSLVAGTVGLVTRRDVDGSTDEVITISSEVATALRQITDGSGLSIDTYLRRLLKLGLPVNLTQDGPIGYRDPSTGLTLPEGFAIYRIWQGYTYNAVARGGFWVTPDGQRFDNLNRLNASLGKPNPENAWICWKFVDRDGREHLLNALRPLPKPRNRRPGRARSSPHSQQQS